MKSWKRKPDPEMEAKTGSRSLLHGKNKIGLANFDQNQALLSFEDTNRGQRSAKEVASRKRR